MPLLTLNDFIDKFVEETDRAGVRDNFHYIEVDKYIYKISEWLYTQWYFPLDEHKGYAKILPIIFCLREVKNLLYKITINGLIFYLQKSTDFDIMALPWTRFQIQFVCRVLTITFKDNCHIDYD